jgi:hypothetical protein
MFEWMPGWAWVLIGWFVASLCLGAAVARWFRWVRG